MPADPPPPKSILQNLRDRQGVAPKVLLPDSDSEHGASPVVDPRSKSSQLLPQGRGNYQIMGEIARGGMSVILKGHDTDLGRDVAVKVLDEDLAQRPELVERFVEEAQIGGQLQHPGIVPVYELGLMADERPYFTMKLIKGRTLASLIAQRKKPTDDRGSLLSVFAAVCQTVAYAHSKGVVHRDLKPANIMVGAFSEVQVVDWGLAKVLARGGVADERRAKETRASLHSIIETVRSGSSSIGSDSMVGSIMGTPAYMAPEQAQGEIEKLDERVDVFSLGAILCEILTGAPPYVEGGEEKVVVQAARAHLDGARKRIEASGADPALVRLCLDCLTPARAARPANADEVAKALQAYLTSTEERAHRAEVAAAEARVKAADERRARFLTLGLGAAVVLALGVGGGAYLWVQRAHADRLEAARSAVDTAQGESIELQQRGRPEEALAAAQRALALARSGAPGTPLEERAARFVEQAQRDADAARRERELLAKDQKLLRVLEDLRLDGIQAINDFPAQQELDQRYRDTFLDYGLDLDAADLVPALELVRDRGIEVPVALALDDWGRVRRKVFGDSSVEAENLYFLAMDLDDDPARMQMREAIATGDRAALVDLAAPRRLDELAASSIFILGSAIWDLFPEERPRVFRIWDHALPYHPDDYVLQSVGGILFEINGHWESSLTCRVAALGQRPDDVHTRARLAQGLLFTGRLVDCVNTAEACIARDPEESDAHYTRSMALLQLGRLDEALTAIERSLEIQENRFIRADEQVNRYLLGLVEPQELLDQLEVTREPVLFATLAFALLVHPDPEQRRSVAVLEMFERSRRDGVPFDEEDWAWLLKTLAYVDLGRWEEAERTMAGEHGPLTISFYPRPVFSFLRALVYAKVDKPDAARECYERGLDESVELMRDDVQGWRQSDLVHWRDRAAELLGG